MKEYRCTRNAPYSHQCIGHDDITARQGYYLNANSSEEAWQKMAIRFPEETEAGFTVQEWEGFNVRVVELHRDDAGNLIEVYRDEEGNITQEVKRDEEGYSTEE